MLYCAYWGHWRPPRPRCEDPSSVRPGVDGVVSISGGQWISGDQCQALDSMFEQLERIERVEEWKVAMIGGGTLSRAHPTSDAPECAHPPLPRAEKRPRA